jgi:hypothetical protein
MHTVYLLFWLIASGQMLEIDPNDAPLVSGSLPDGLLLLKRLCCKTRVSAKSPPSKSIAGFRLAAYTDLPGPQFDVISSIEA